MGLFQHFIIHCLGFIVMMMLLSEVWQKRIHRNLQLDYRNDSLEALASARRSKGRINATGKAGTVYPGYHLGLSPATSDLSCIREHPLLRSEQMANPPESRMHMYSLRGARTAKEGNILLFFPVWCFSSWFPHLSLRITPGQAGVHDVNIAIQDPVRSLTCLWKRWVTASMEWEWNMKRRSKRRRSERNPAAASAAAASSTSQPAASSQPARQTLTASAVEELRQAGVQCSSSSETEAAASAAGAEETHPQEDPHQRPRGYIKDPVATHRSDAQHSKGPRDREDEEDQRKPQPRISIVGSNWGGARKLSGKNRVAKATQKLLEVPAHIQCALEIVTAQIAQELREAGYEVAQIEEGGPAVIYLSDNFTLEHIAAKTFLTSTDKYGGTGLFTRLAPIRPGFEPLNIMTCHLHYGVAKQRQLAEEVCTALRQWATKLNVDIIFLDANQHAHPRWENASLLSLTFLERDGWIMPAFGAPLFGRTQKAVEEGGACTGFIVHTRLLGKAILWSHGTWDTPPEWGEYFNPQDTGWHRSMFMNLQSVSIAAGFRTRSDKALQRRKERRQERGWKRPWRQQSWWSHSQWASWSWSTWPAQDEEEARARWVPRPTEAASAAGSRDAPAETRDADAASAVADYDTLSPAPSDDSSPADLDAASAAAAKDEESESADAASAADIPVPALYAIDDPELPGVTSAPSSSRRPQAQEAPVTVDGALIEESVRSRPTEAVISRIHAIYLAHRRAHNVQAQIKKYRELYGTDGIHALCVALERKYGKECMVHLSVIHRGPRYRWQTKDIPEIGRMTGPDRPSPTVALTEWIRINSRHLQYDSAENIERIAQEAIDLAQHAEAPASAGSQGSSSSQETRQGAGPPASAGPVETPPASAEVERLHTREAEAPLTTEQIQTVLQSRLKCRRLPPLSATNNWKALLIKHMEAGGSHQCLVLALPKLILCMPTTIQNPRQQEAYVNENLILAHRDAWQTLFSRAQNLFLQPPPPHQDLAHPERGDSLSTAEARRLIRLARTGQPSKAWKQLNSPGLAPINEASFTDALHKLKPRGDPEYAPKEAPQYWQAPQPTWHKVMKLLKRKRAADPGGWTTELWMLTWDDQLHRERMLTWLQGISAPQASPDVRHMLSITQLIMISKSSGGTRPHLTHQSIQEDLSRSPGPSGGARVTQYY